MCNDTRQVHHRADTRIAGIEHTAGAAQVAVDVDVLAGQNLGVRVGVDVVAHTQQHGPIGRVDQAMRDDHGRVLEEQHRATGQQVQVLTLSGALAHREPRVCTHGVAAARAQRLDQHDLRVLAQARRGRQGFCQVDAAAGPRTDGAVAVGLRVDLQVVVAVGLRVGDVAADGAADVAALRQQVDGVADDAGRVGSQAAVAGIDDRTVLCRQRHVALGIDGIDLQVADRLGAEQGRGFGPAQHFADEDALGVEARRGVEGLEHAERRPGAVQHIDIDLQEIVGRTDAALAFRAADAVVAGGQRDVATRDIGVHADAAVVERIDDAARRIERDVARSGHDAAHAQIAGLFIHGDEAIRQHIDVMRVA